MMRGRLLMDAFESMLKEEQARLKVVEKGYRQAISKLPEGSVQKKRIKEHSYPYLVRSKKGKVQYEYLGKLPEAEVEALKEKIAMRKKYKALLKKVKSNKQRVERALRGKK